jgi:hypothetical protein
VRLDRDGDIPSRLRLHAWDDVIEKRAMLRKRREPKRKSIAMTLMRDIQGSAAEKLAMIEKVRAAGRFAKEDPPTSKRRSGCCAMEKGTERT